jgi:uncharacterized protein YndB with AHSA1/START domain
VDVKREQTAFVYTTYIQAGPERVWQGLTDPALMVRYWRHQKAGPKTFRSDWKKGSTYVMTHDEVGLVVSGDEQVILESDPPRRLAYTWHTITPNGLTRWAWTRLPPLPGEPSPGPRSPSISRMSGTAPPSSRSPTTASSRAALCSLRSPTGGPPSCRA